MGYLLHTAAFGLVAGEQQLWLFSAAPKAMQQLVSAA
jgi:hypothetical protein